MLSNIFVWPGVLSRAGFSEKFAEPPKLSLPVLTVEVNGEIVIRPLSIFTSKSLLPMLKPIYSALSKPKVVFAFRLALNLPGAFLGYVLENHSESLLLPLAEKPCGIKGETIEDTAESS